MKINLFFLLFLLCYTCRAQDIDVTHMRLQLSFDWQKKQTNGIATITLLPKQPTKVIRLDAAYLTIEQISEAGMPLEFQYKGGDSNKNLKIELNKRLGTDQPCTLSIAYRTNYINQSDPNAIWGSFGKGLRYFEPTSTTPAKRKQLWSSGEPTGNKYWFPCNEDMEDIHTTEIIATVEKPLTVAATGSLLKTIDNKNGTQTFYYKSSQAYPNYLVALVVGEYTDVVQQKKNNTVHNFGYPDEKEAVKATKKILPEMVTFLQERTGYVLPHAEYKQVVVQDYPFPGGIGQHAMSILSDNYIDDYHVHQDFKYLWDGVAMQALANQYFGNLIMPKRWNDIWLNNAFAQFFADLHTIIKNGRAEHLLYVYPFEKTNVWNDWNAGNRHPVVPDEIKDLPTFTTDSYSKFKGALILHMLQQELGEQLWWKVVKQYVNTQAHKQVSTKDFQETVGKVSGKNYQWFFNQWIYNMGLPKLVVTKEYNAHKKELTIEVKQIQTQDSNSLYLQTTFFEGQIQIELNKKIEKVYLKPQLANTYHFPCDEEPLFVNVNFEQQFLCELEETKTKEELLSQLQLSKDILAKQEAGNQLVSICSDSSMNETFKNQVKQILMKEIHSSQYWRYRTWALGALFKIIKLPYSATEIALLKSIIKNEKSWLKNTAITILGKTEDSNHIEIYKAALRDTSDRVINAAAIALGQTRSSQAFELLMSLENQKSWKNQNRISALNGLEKLGDQRAVEYALQCINDKRSPRWYLATPVWDYPFAAVNTLMALGKGSLAYSVLFDRFKKSLEENDLNDLFQNVQLIDLLKDQRAKEMYALLKEKFKDDASLLETIHQYELNYLNSIK